MPDSTVRGGAFNATQHATTNRRFAGRPSRTEGQDQPQSAQQRQDGDNDPHSLIINQGISPCVTRSLAVSSAAPAPTAKRCSEHGLAVQARADQDHPAEGQGTAPRCRAADHPGQGRLVANRRLAFARLRDNEAVGNLFTILGPRYANRPGGYLRLLKCGFRAGDNAPMAYVELVDRPVVAEEVAE